MERSLRLARLLGEMRRQMNGAVVGSMRLYGEEYGLNYGVSLSSIRSIAREELSRGGYDRRFAELLYKQEVREMRLASFWFMAEGESIDLDLWGRGIINSEVAEEAAFALLCRSDEVCRWLESPDELLCYAALMSLARGGGGSLGDYTHYICDMLRGEVHILQNGVVALLDSALRGGNSSLEEVQTLLESLPECGATNFIREEMEWRMELL